MLKPETEADLADAVAQAQGPLAIRGGGTRPIGGTRGGDVLSVSGLNGIELYEPGALTVVAQAGTPVADIEAALRAEGQRLAFEPMDHRVLLGTGGTPTIGGVVAGNVSGPRRIQAGACRDAVLGLRFVDGRGTVLKNGGRVMKNVTGYDLVKLLCGSFGTLGVLSQVSLKVLPAPEAVATLRVAGLDVAQAVAAMSSALGSPYEITGAAHLAEEPSTLLRIEGFAQSVTYRAEQLATLLGAFGPVEVETEPDRCARLWARVRDVEDFADRSGDVWRISVKPTDAPDLALAIAAADASARIMFDWGGGLLWVLTSEGTDLRPGVSGHATLLRASEQTRSRLGTFHPEPAPIAAISAGLRARFDPRGILNSGLMG